MAPNWQCYLVMGTVIFVLGTCLMIGGIITGSNARYNFAEDQGFWILFWLGITVMIVGSSLMAVGRRLRLLALLQNHSVMVRADFVEPQPIVYYSNVPQPGSINSPYQQPVPPPYRYAYINQGMAHPSSPNEPPPVYMPKDTRPPTQQ